MVLEVLYCPESRYRHEAWEGTALQLSEKTVHRMCVQSLWSIFRSGLSCTKNTHKQA